MWSKAHTLIVHLQGPYLELSDRCLVWHGFWYQEKEFVNLLLQQDKLKKYKKVYVDWDVVSRIILKGACMGKKMEN